MLKGGLLICGLGWIVGCSYSKDDKLSSTADTVSTISVSSQRQDSVQAGSVTASSTEPEVLVWIPGEPDTVDIKVVPNFRARATRLSADSMLLTFVTPIPGKKTKGGTRSYRVADSAVVAGLFAHEILNTDCRQGLVRTGGQVVGIVSGTVWDHWERARLAWRFDTLTKRIHSIPPDSILCLRMQPEE